MFVEPARTRYTKVSTNGPHRTKRILLLSRIYTSIEEISRKRKIRGGHSAYVTQLITTIDNENDEAALKSLKSQLEEKKSNLKQQDDEILELVSKVGDEEGSGCADEVSNAGNFLQTIETSIAKIRNKLKIIQQTPSVAKCTNQL